MELVKSITRRIKTSHKRLRFHFAQKIILGSAGILFPGWLTTDKSSLDILKYDDFQYYWQPNSRSKFLAEHVWEHFDENEVRQANDNCFEFLQSGGKLRLAVPDGFHPDPEYLEKVRPGGTGEGAEDHKILYNYQSLTDLLEDSGFRINLLEYWDESGQFHFQEWSSEEGHIRRSMHYDSRNQNGSLTYTSLIVDAIKP